MDFFNDPSLFGGGLEGLDDDGFASAPSLVDELNLTADFEPLQVEPLGPGKHQDMMPPASTQQAMPSYSQSMGHYIDIKANVAQAFSGSQGISEGMITEQHGSYHNAPMSQVPQSNGLFCNSGSPMWGNQDQNGNMYQALPQQQLCHQQQQLQSQQLHGRHQTQHHPCYQQEEQQHRMRQQQLQQQQSHQQQLLNQHQQINTQTVSLQQQHHNFPFHQGGQSSSQQQIHHTQQQVQRQLTVREQQLHSGALPNKHYLESQNASMTATCLQTQPQQASVSRPSNTIADLDGLEPPDLLPQLECGFKQEDKSNGGWTDTTQEMGIEYSEDKTDASVISLTDEELKTYLPSHGDPLAVFGFCRRRGSSRKSAPFERLKSKLSKRKLSEEDGSSTRQEEHSQTTHKRNALKRNRKIEIGWMHYDEDAEVFKQVRSRRGGGTRKIDICKDAKKRDILQVATGLFFPDGGNIQGPLTDFDCDLKDYQEMIVDRAVRYNDIYRMTI